MMAPETSSVHLPTNTSPRDNAAIADNSQETPVSTTIGTNNSSRSYLEDPA